MRRFSLLFSTKQNKASLLAGHVSVLGLDRSDIPQDMTRFARYPQPLPQQARRNAAGQCCHSSPGRSALRPANLRLIKANFINNIYVSKVNEVTAVLILKRPRAIRQAPPCLLAYLLARAAARPVIFFVRYDFR